MSIPLHEQNPLHSRHHRDRPNGIKRLSLHAPHPHLASLRIKLIHTKNQLGKFSNLFNRNHRHDEAHEQAVDKKRLTVAESNRFQSFAPVRLGNEVKWYVDGRDYFWAVSIALEAAKEVIYIEDWWLSPELHLRRPPSEHKKWRLDEILKRKAEQGVKIYVSVYKEVSQAITCNSAHTKASLENLCPDGSPGHGNIVCMRHPDHGPLKGADMTWFWAHHEKFIVIDHKLAFIGGLDACFGRWDTTDHPLADIHPTGVSNEIWSGQDFNNNRILDFQRVEDWEQNKLDKRQFGRMPWHDVSIGIIGPAVMDIAQHFVGRWNFVKRDKYKRHTKFPWLQLEGVPDDLLSVEHPSFPVGGYARHPLHPLAEYPLENRGPCEVQIVRSSSDWSHGISPKEQSIQTAYRTLISQAQKFVYIENQFFITATGDQQAPVHNTIGAAIVEAIERAHKEGRKFRVIVIIPAIPGFPGDLREEAANGTRAIIDYQYKSIHRGPHSIFGRLQAMDIDPSQYIFFFNLRSYDRLHTTEQLLDREKETGITYGEVQLANANEVMGSRGVTQDDSSSSSGSEASSLASGKGANMAADREKFERDGDLTNKGEHAADTIAKDAMRSGMKVKDEIWDDGEEQEKKNFINEELYVHAKVLIVDDEIMCVGSSNINDRSQHGSHDSELTAVVHHYETVSTLRKQLWQEHLGLLPPQPLDGADDPNCYPPGDPDRPNRPASDPLVEDPLSDKLWSTWTSRATTNTEVFRNLFHCDPDDNVRTWKDYDEFLPKGKVPAGHLYGDAAEWSCRKIKKELGKIRGHLVWMPLKFLEEEEMAEKGLTVNAYTESVFT